MTDGGPRKRHRGEVRAVSERLKDHTVGLSSIEAIEPHAPNLSSNARKLGEGLNGLPQRGERVAVDGGTGRLVDQFVQVVVLAAAGQFGPSLGSNQRMVSRSKRSCPITHLTTFPAANVDILEGVLQSPLMPLPADQAHRRGGVPAQHLGGDGTPHIALESGPLARHGRLGQPEGVRRAMAYIGFGRFL